MEQSLVILGRLPALSIAELESLYGAANVRSIGSSAALLTMPVTEVSFDRLGGAIKLCKVLSMQPTTNWGDIERYLVKTSPEHARMLPEGKMQVGLSAYELKESAQRIMATGLSLKKAIKKTGRSIRLTPNQEPALNSAQVAHNHLTSPTGWELVFVRDGDSIIVAQTVAVQDLDSYTLRDRGRPKRDSRVGMLPPKLAQTIINVAVGDIAPTAETTVLDPFCGTGVLLQETLLMGFKAYGTDLEPRMIDYSAHNIDWLGKHFPDLPQTQLEIGDATSHQWNPAPHVVATETYLGRPFTTLPPNDILAQNMTDCNLIIKKFLRNIANQTPAGTRMCIAIPAWQIRPGEFKHLPLIDQISEMGYNRVSFEHVRDDELLYYREDQVVARELIVITRN